MRRVPSSGRGLGAALFACLMFTSCSTGRVTDTSVPGPEHATVSSLEDSGVSSLEADANGSELPTATSISPPPTFTDFGAIENLQPTIVEHFERKAECLREEGYDVELAPDGEGLTIENVTGVQRIALMEASARCEEQVGSLPVFVPATLDDIQPLYDSLVAMRDCLIEEGYEIADAPALDTFFESYLTDPWHPYLSIPLELGEGEWNRLQEACPQG